jgi:uncharacterized SAM-binding protein YcdF (DUF218 family)
MLQAAKSLADVLTSPLAAAGGLLIIAAALRFFRFHIAAALIAAAALVGVYAASIPFVGQALLRPLEDRYPPLTTIPTADTVVVLGSSYSPRPGVSVATALDDSGLVRIMSGIDWVKRLHARLVVSGGATEGRVPSAHGYAALATELGIPPDQIVMLASSLNTGDEALAVAALLDSRPFVLVTSASHMPRAMRLMKRVGAEPIPAPTDQRISSYEGLHWSQFVPRASALQDSEEALHEYLGLVAIFVGID